MHDDLALPATARIPGIRLAWAGVAPEPALRSGVPVFLGFVRAGAARTNVRSLTGWEDFAHFYGGAAPGYLADAVHGFFLNGGGRCWVMPVPVPDAAAADALAAGLAGCLAPGGPLEDLPEPDLVCVPDATWGVLADEPAAMRTVQLAALEHCNRLNDRLALLDCPPPTPLPAHAPAVRAAEMAAQRRQARMVPLVALSSDDGARLAQPQETPRPAGRGRDAGQVANGAAYWPWIAIDPQAGVRHRDAAARHAAGSLRLVPPCGHVAGVIARIDAAAGRHKAPANEVLRGALDVDDEASDEEIAALQDLGVNCLRALPGRGVRIWGARTLSDRPEARYVNVRRVILGLARWAEIGLRDLVMECHTPALWERLRQRVSAWCLQRYHEGALQGDSPAEAFFVKCDEEINPRERRERGEIVCLVGLAARAPAEFIVVELLPAGGGSVLVD
jgi:hypothetical protein